MLDSSNSLLAKYETLKKSYYEIDIAADNFFGKANKDNLENCEKFIAAHLEKGGKDEVHEIPWIREFQRSNKHIHVVSLYLLGLTFQDSMSALIKEEIGHFILSHDWYDYKYTLFLTCLYHDIASNIECGKIPANPTEQKKHLTYYLGDNNIQYTIFDRELSGDTYHPRLSASLVKNYFYYRASCGECDHGILGGYYLFDRLYKNFLKNTRNGVSTDNLLRRKEHIPHFAYISDAIICHNIWTAQSFDISESDRPKIEKSIETYKCFGLSPLIYKSSEDRLKFEEYPLQFLLCLLDTIEPIKRFNEGCIDMYPYPEDILNSIDISINVSNVRSQKFEITICWDAMVNNWSGFERWREGILKTSNWLHITVDENCSDNSVLISF